MIYSLAVNRDGSLIATTSKDRKLRVIEPRTGIVVSVSLEIIPNELKSASDVDFVSVTGERLPRGDQVLEGDVFGQRETADDRILAAFRPAVRHLGPTQPEGAAAPRGHGQLERRRHPVLRLRHENGSLRLKNALSSS